MLRRQPRELQRGHRPPAVDPPQGVDRDASADAGYEDIRQRKGGGSPLAETVGDRIPAIATEASAGDLHAWRRLAALVLGEEEQVFDAHHQRAIVSRGDRLVDRAL